VDVKVYLASAFRLVPRVEEIAKALEDRGHTITVKWWSTDGFNLHDRKMDNAHPDAFYDHPVCRMICERDIRGVRDADVLVLVAGDNPSAFNGANVEYGIALGLGKQCFAIGSLDNSALYWPMHRCISVEELLDRLNVLSMMFFVPGGPTSIPEER
jgi:nucleoside 2-deoxyribosyltransferase